MEEEVEEEEDLSRRPGDERGFDPKVKTSGHVYQNSGEVSLREWLDKPKRPVDFVECLHIFRQVVQAVSLAHSQGVVVNNIRPSCFVLSTLSRVSFIESASCSDTSCGEEECSYAAGAAVCAGDQMASIESVEGKGDLYVASEAYEWTDFPLKKILSMEFTWYASPEEVEGKQSTFASDVYKLGVLLFELFCMFENLEDKLGKMSNLRERVLPPQMLLKWPKEASFCLWLLHPQPSSRPTMSELLQIGLLNEEIDSLEEREAAIKLKEETEELELLLGFLLQLQTKKVEAADKLHDTICFLCADMEEVESQRSSLMKNGCSFLGLEKSDHGTVHKFECPLPYYEINEDSSSSGSRKRIKPGHEGFIAEKFNENLLDGSIPNVNKEAHEKIPSKSSRILKNFKKLEEAYFSSRHRTMRPMGQHFSSKMLVSNPSSGSTVRTEGSSVYYLASKEGRDGRKVGDLVNPFLEGLCKYLSFSKFKVRAEVKQGDLLNSNKLICSLVFDRDQEFFATAGVNRKIKVFECDAILNEDHNIHYPVVEMTSRAKLSNICWNGYIKSQIASSDFEGIVQLWDIARREFLIEMREHEKRVWSVNYSLVDPTKLASGSDDGTVKLWNINQGGSTGTIITKANVCSVQFPPDSASVLAIGSADHNVYYYDLRNVRLPLLTLTGHARTVSYVKFVDSSTLVSSSTDNSLKLWDLSVSSSGVIENPIQTFTGHTNVKNFVGLSIADGYIATGSETNEVGNVHVIKKANLVTYRGPTMVANTLHACAILLRKKKKWDWFINLSASDYPLVTQDDLLFTFSTLPRNLNFVEHTSRLGWKAEQRAKPLIIDPGLYMKSKSDVLWVSPKRELPNAFRLFTGSAWMALSRDFVEFCIYGWDNLPRTLLMYYTNFISSSEGYFQTLICNLSEFNNTVVNHDLHYISWDDPPQQHPQALALADLEKMISGKAPFARKFKLNDSVLDKIDEEFLSRGEESIVPGGWCSGEPPCSDIGDEMRLEPGAGSHRLGQLMNRLVRSEKFKFSQCR